MATASWIALRRSPISMAPGAAARIAARIVSGTSERGLSSVTIDHVGQPRRDLAHDRPLAAVAVAAAAEHHDDAAGGERPHRSEHVLQRVGLVRIVDIDRRAVGGGADELEPARRALQMFQRSQRLAGRIPVAIAKPAATSAL